MSLIRILILTKLSIGSTQPVQSASKLVLAEKLTVARSAVLAPKDLFSILEQSPGYVFSISVIPCQGAETYSASCKLPVSYLKVPNLRRVIPVSSESPTTALSI